MVYLRSDGTVAQRKSFWRLGTLTERELVFFRFRTLRLPFRLLRVLALTLYTTRVPRKNFSSFLPSLPVKHSCTAVWSIINFVWLFISTLSAGSATRPRGERGYHNYRSGNGSSSGGGGGGGGGGNNGGPHRRPPPGSNIRGMSSIAPPRNLGGGG